MSPLACPACGTEQSPTDPAVVLASEILRCTSCKARIAYGQIVPRIVVEPVHTESQKTLIRVRFQDPVTMADQFSADMDPVFAAGLAKNILALVIP